MPIVDRYEDRVTDCYGVRVDQLLRIMTRGHTEQEVREAVTAVIAEVREKAINLDAAGDALHHLCAAIGDAQLSVLSMADCYDRQEAREIAACEVKQLGWVESLLLKGAGDCWLEYWTNRQAPTWFNPTPRA